VDPAIVADLPAAPTDPAALDQFVHAHIPWASDAAVWGLPWYFPTPGEVVRAGRGDCEAQAVVLASLLAARGVPYSFRASFSHLWVDYPGRLQRQGERDGEAMMANVGGRYRFRWPELPQLSEHFSAQVELLWTPLDPLRKILLLLGWPLICYARWRRRPMA
ncbi:MAG: hypothetical protein HUU35_11140, partial [Armatimonadetes bacterium]|nr:hypothetical protein [Armatimonadota bacterium]